MLPASPSETPSQTADDCTICLSTLAPGTPLLTLSCNHKFHLQCLATNVQAKNKECPLCRAAIDASVIQLLGGYSKPPVQVVQSPNNTGNASSASNVPPSVEEPVDEAAVRILAERLTAERQAAIASSHDVNNLPMITTVTTLEYGAQVHNQESNIYGLVTLQAPSILQADAGIIATSRVPIDLVCVVDQSGSMSGEKIALLKQTLIYIVEQLNELDRLAIISFNMNAFDRSHGLKRMNQQNQQTLTAEINNISSSGGTYIGSGLQMGIDLLRNRQTKNSLGALLLLTDGQDNEQHDYTQLMGNLPEGVQCHTFGYGPDHTAALLVQIAELGSGGTFTYIDQEQAVGPAFAMALAGLFTCIAQQIQVNIEFNGEYKVTHFHSKYSYEPESLPSSKLSIKLHNLYADEKRNLVFQIHVPKVIDDQNVDMASQQPMSQDESSIEQQFYENQTIGHVNVTYTDPSTNRLITTIPVAFQLVRASHPSADLLQVNHTLDRQRNRVETAQALQRAMDETDYKQSRAIVKAQADKIKASVSAQDPFCQELIRDLEQSYPDERDYRSSHHHTYRSHQTERGFAYSAPASSSLDESWLLYKRDFEKQYSSIAEEQARQDIWKKNDAMINIHNLEAELGMHTYTMKINQFADLTLEEFAKKMLTFTIDMDKKHGKEFRIPSNTVLPDAVDWRTKGIVTPVKDQGQCGSCYVFSVTGSLEGQQAKQSGKLVSLSEQQIVDCSRAYGNEGCNGGYMDNCFRYIKDNKGLDTEDSYPYEAKDGTCRFNKKTVGANVTGYVDVKNGSEIDLQHAIATVGPIVIAIDAQHDSFRFYSSGVYSESQCSTTQLDFSMLAVGYNATATNQEYYIVKNQWTTSWGMQGYIWMSRNKNNQCGIATLASYPLI